MSTALFDAKGVAGLRQGRGQGRGARQADDLHAAVLGGGDGIAAGPDFEADLAAVHPALGLELIGVAGEGQGLYRGLALDGHGEVAGDQQKRAEGHRLAGAEEPVRQHPADQGQQIDQGGVGGVLALAEVVGEQELFGQVEDQQTAHAVVGEPLPHLGEEQHEQAAWMAAQLQRHRDAGRNGDEDADDDDDVEHEAPNWFAAHVITQAGLSQASHAS